MTSTRAAASPSEWAPGARALVSGVYRVLHGSHRPVRSVVVIKGDEFPVCRNCHDKVRYQLWMEADYVSQDWDLSGPNTDLIK